VSCFLAKACGICSLSKPAATASVAATEAETGRMIVMMMMSLGHVL